MDVYTYIACQYSAWYLAKLYYNKKILFIRAEGNSIAILSITHKVNLISKDLWNAMRRAIGCHDRYK